MQASDIPGKLPIPFANSAGGGFIRSIPVASQIGVVPGAASLTTGFPPLNFQPIDSGGIPPNGADFNGILFEISGWARWVAAGGPVFFDGTFATAIGGYPKGAAIMSATTPGAMFVSTADNNTTNPESGGSANWISLSPIPATLAELRAGLNTTKYVNSETLAGLRADLSDLVTGADGAKYVTPLALAELRASGLEARAGTDPAKYISPLTLAGVVSEIIAGAASAGGNSSVWFALPISGLPSPLIVQGGKVIDGGSNPITCNYAKTGITTVLFAGGIPYTNGTGGFSDQDGFIGVAGSPGPNSMLFAVSRRGGDQHVDGCYWWVAGYQ